MTQMEKYLEEVENQYGNEEISYEQYRQYVKEILEEFGED